MIKALTLTVVAVICALTILVRAGQAGIAHQTVPTMPPPTATRTQTPQQTSTHGPGSTATQTTIPQKTSTYIPQPTATSFLATPTRNHPTDNPSTATLEILASGTARALSNTSTSIAPQMTHNATTVTYNHTPTNAGPMAIIATVVLSPMPSQEQALAEEGENLGLYGLAAGVIALSGIVLISLMRKRKQNQEELN